MEKLENNNMFLTKSTTIASTAIPYIPETHPTTDPNSNFFNPNWDNNPMDQTDPFESALSSMVSSPNSSNANCTNENIVLRELIGRLGSICNSGEISPHHQPPFSSANTSCYSTPLNSPPKLNLSVMNLQTHAGSFAGLAPFAADPGFAERAARFSCFAGKGLDGMAPNLDSCKISGDQSVRVSGFRPENGILGSDKKLSENENGDSGENSSVSEQITGGETAVNARNDANSRKRKEIPKGKGKGKGKETPAPAKDANVASENSESSAKRNKSEDEKDAVKSKGDKQSKDDSKAAEAPKDYIHVRARRGQATDAHSLAERVRREKISGRMKVLQDLVPGCNKVTGKAVMLDEIINYVQSLQRQVEFLSMKLATVNPRMDVNMEALITKDMFQSRGGSMPHNMYPSDGYPFPSQPNLHTIPSGTEAQFAANNFGAAFGRNQLPSMDNFSESGSQVSTFWEDDLHSVVQMGFGQNQTQNFNGILPTSQMKVEL